MIPRTTSAPPSRALPSRALRHELDHGADHPYGWSMSRSLPVIAMFGLLCMACECQEVADLRGNPERLSLTLWGMADAADDAAMAGVSGEGRYAVAVDPGDIRSATLVLRNGDLDLAAEPLDGEQFADPAPDAGPVLTIELDQSAVPEPGAQRTLQRQHFDAVRVRAVIDGTVFVDSRPTVDIALDLATGATTVNATGVLERVGGLEAAARPYTIEGRGITPIDCSYRIADVGETWMPPEGQVDVCRALVDEAAALPMSADTPELPWDATRGPAVQTICGI